MLEWPDYERYCTSTSHPGSMNIWLGVTDNDWFAFLRRLAPEEVNFWQPGGSQPFRALSLGQPFLFKLKRPHNHIAGGGFFVNHTFLPLTVAWETFGLKNGMPDYWSFAAKKGVIAIDDLSIVTYPLTILLPTPMFEANVITITALAREQQCSRQAIYNAIQRGDLNTTYLGTQIVVVKDEKYDAYHVKETGGRLHKRFVEKRKEK